MDLYWYTHSYMFTGGCRKAPASSRGQGNPCTETARFCGLQGQVTSGRHWFPDFVTCVDHQGSVFCYLLHAVFSKSPNILWSLSILSPTSSYTVVQSPPYTGPLDDKSWSQTSILYFVCWVHNGQIYTNDAQHYVIYCVVITCS